MAAGEQVSGRYGSDERLADTVGARVFWIVKVLIFFIKTVPVVSEQGCTMTLNIELRYEGVLIVKAALVSRCGS